MVCCTLYKITNLVNGKVYIGQTWGSIETRFLNHKRRDVAKGGCVKLGNAFKKYGDGSFFVEAVGSVGSQELADYLERAMIVEHGSIQNGYNLRGGGSHGRHSEETKALLSNLRVGRPSPMKGRKRSAESCAKMSLSHMGLKASDDARAKMSRAKKGRPPPNKGQPRLEATKAKIALAQTGKKASDETRARMRLSRLRWLSERGS